MPQVKATNLKLCGLEGWINGCLWDYRHGRLEHLAAALIALKKELNEITGIASPLDELKQIDPGIVASVQASDIFSTHKR